MGQGNFIAGLFGLAPNRVTRRATRMDPITSTG